MMWSINHSGLPRRVSINKTNTAIHFLFKRNETELSINGSGTDRSLILTMRLAVIQKMNYLNERLFVTSDLTNCGCHMRTINT